MLSLVNNYGDELNADIPPSVSLIEKLKEDLKTNTIYCKSYLYQVKQNTANGLFIKCLHPDFKGLEIITPENIQELSKHFIYQPIQ